MAGARGETQSLFQQAGQPSYGANDEGPRGPTDPDVGLSFAEAARRLKEFGPNELEAAETQTFLQILFKQMGNLIFLLTSCAAVVCYLTGDDIKTTFLVSLVIFVCFFNAVGEYSGQDASAALRNMEEETANVVRDGHGQAVPVKMLVPGDIVHLATGKMVPADIRVVKSVDLQTNEAVLTGEPKEMLKTEEPQETDSRFPTNMCFKNTAVVGGHGIGEVVSTGMETQVGLIAKRLGAQPKKLNPLQISINTLGKIIASCCFVVIVTAAVVSFAMQYPGYPPACAPGDVACFFNDATVRGLLMAVAIIPHGLPLVVMVMLRVGSSLMAGKKAVVTRQSAVDYLGATQVICTDKTGTLTEGKMAAKLFIGLSKEAKGPKRFELAYYPLKGLSPKGNCFLSTQLTTKKKELLDAGRGLEDAGLDDVAAPQGTVKEAPQLFARAASAAAYLSSYGVQVVQKNGGWDVIGNMSDGALKVAGVKGHIDGDSVFGREIDTQHPRHSDLEVQFTSSRKMSATVHTLAHGNGEFAAVGADVASTFPAMCFGPSYTHIVLLKGAPDRVLPHLSAALTVSSGALTLSKEGLTKEDRQFIDGQNASLARQALRSLMMACKPLTKADVAKLQAAQGGDARLKMMLETGNLAFFGLWGIFDPPRSSVPPSIKMAHEAFIRVVMITGDQRPTAIAIGKQVGIISENDNEKLVARRCSDLHEDDMEVIRQNSANIGRKSSVGLIQRLTSSFRQPSTSQPDAQASNAGKKVENPGLAPTLVRQRTLSVHDVKSKKDQHEAEYKSDEDINHMTHDCCIWSRASPTDKVAIVDSLVKQGMISAMTGDGVNDAPALTHADIGVSMGISGTQVTQNAASMILMDDNFSTIVAAVAEGRKIYGNVQKYVLFNITVKGSECLALLTTIVLGLPQPIAGLQQLVNLFVTHILPPMSLVYEDAEDYTMNIPPRDTKTDLVINKVHIFYRWIPFIIGYTVIIVSNMCLGLWMHTGYVHIDYLVGSSVAGAIKGNGACEYAGYLDRAGNFVQDATPFHCVCNVRRTLMHEKPDVVDQWGRPDSSAVVIDRFTGSTGDFYDRANTPYSGLGKSQLIELCVDAEGVERNCWRDPNAERPLLYEPYTCSRYGAKLALTMSYASIQLGEVLSLMTFRTDGFVGRAKFSPYYMSMLFLNICTLIVVLYVPAITGLLGLAPLTLGRLLMALVPAFMLVAMGELIKIEYRHRLRTEHALHQVFTDHV
eukprot:CAMPEP_0117621350 /NCGR_PEP_ID=MMETSP0784-20121206/87590_1 /TAXON_ID=39447 /ORGANISM="" /LENGTH=1233 /DNA_ID=CAMNT_0005425275 /DNA_START=67 /DNA_END=3768 /DNA_ORIENTATION=-